MGSGTDVAIETSDVVLMNSDLSRLSHALGLSKAIVRNMRQNIVIAVGVVIVLFAGVFFSEWVGMSVECWCMKPVYWRLYSTVLDFCLSAPEKEQT